MPPPVTHWRHDRSRVRLAGLMVAWVLFAGTACRDLVEPVQAPPRIEEISFRTGVWYDVTPAEGVLWLSSWAADAEFRASEHSAFPVEVRVSSGDAEQATLKKALCGPKPDGWDPWFCDGIIVDMKEGFSVAGLYPRLSGLEGRYTTPPSIGHFAGIQLFGVSLTDAMRTVSRWPGVRRVEPSGVFRHPSNTMPMDEWVGRSLLASLKLDVTSPVIGNGTIELAEGDTITVRYVQPDSMVYTKSFIFAPRPASSEGASPGWEVQRSQ